MKENFTPQMDKKTDSIEPQDLKNFNKTLEKCREFLKSKSKDLRVGAMVLLSMGAFQEVQVQSEVDYYKNALTEIKLGKSDINHLVGKTYDEHKKENVDSSFFVLENSTFTEIVDNTNKRKYISENPKISGVPISIDSEKDTITLGDVEVKNFIVSCVESHHHIKNNTDDINRYDYMDKHKLYSAIKINPEIDNDKNFLNDKFSNKEFPIYGKTREEAVIMALAEASKQEKSYILNVFSENVYQYDKNVIYNNENSDNKSLSKEDVINFSYMESNNTLNNVRIVLHKDKSDVSNQEMYHADVIYN